MQKPLPEPTTVHRFPLRSRILCACLALLLGLCTSLDASAAGQGSVRFSELAQPTRLHAGDAVIRALPMYQPIHVEIALKLRDKEGLNAFLSQKAIASPMSQESFMALHAPTAAQAQAVADYLAGHGFNNIVIAPNRLLVSADGTAMKARDAFTTSFAQIRTHDGRIAYANTDAVRIPSALQDSVTAVLGLQNVHVAHTQAMPPSTSSVRTQTVSGHPPSDFPSMYGIQGGTMTASSIAVGLVTFGSLNRTKTDLNAYTTANGLPAVQTTTVNTNGTSTDSSGTAEWDLESQSLLGMAGQIARLYFYNVPDNSNANLVADFNAAVVQNATKIIAVSMTECETDAGPSGDNSAAAADEIFAAAMMQGQTFAIANGDHGADECGDGGTTPSWPADSPYVMAVAGTTDDPSKMYPNAHIVWNTLGNPGGGASGGSQSTFEPAPSWQSPRWSGTNRGVADVALDADPNSGALVIVNGAQQQLGGTGLSASLFAGLWARVLQNNDARHPGYSIGSAGPLVYRYFSSWDVTVGNNGGFQAVSGYDLASGLGAPDYLPLVQDMYNTRVHCCHLGPVSAFDYSSSGDTASLFDQSTLHDGASIEKRTWHFGDGTSSSSLAAPTHAYAVDGRYSVTYAITDGFGASSSVTIPLTVSTSGSLQLVGNGGFEQAGPWQYSDQPFNWKCNSTTYLPHSGKCLAVFGGSGGFATQTVQRPIAIPANKTSATLSFSLRVLLGSTGGEQLLVNILSPTGKLLANPRKYTDSNASPGYITRTADLSQFIGDSFILQFKYVQAGGDANFEIDDVTINVQ